MIYLKLGGIFDLDKKELRIKEIESKINTQGFWDNISVANKIIEEFENLKKEIKIFEELSTEYIDLFELSKDTEYKNIILEELEKFDSKIYEFKIKVLLNGEYDKSNAIMEIHSGAGGTESNDWVTMLFEMYRKYFENHGFNYEIISKQPGEEVGYKGITILIKGYNAYGYLKGETGVHRLVRISPFDSNKRRHTTFASVLVTFEIDTDIKVEIKESDLRIDVYRSSGAGGQSVNTTDSAVRITHLPTNIVVTCQNERSQLKNKEMALKILKSKLYAIEKQNLENTIKDSKGEVMDVNFGSAIRSYVMTPYTLVKDTRTNAETSDVNGVLNGNLDLFINSYIERNC